MHVLIALLSLFLCCSALAKRLQPEADYQAYFADKVDGQTEVVVGDGTRCDIVTDTHAIEVDFADKWGESIGQALNYAFQLEKRAGIVLILEHEDDYRHFLRVNSIIRYHGLNVDTWAIKAYEGEGLTNAAPQARLSGDGEYWISSTGKTHRKGCRYFGRGKGYRTNNSSRESCRSCRGGESP